MNVSWVPGKRFVFGPVWDFDLSAGTTWKGSTPTDGWYTRTGKSWISRMLQDPAFSKRVKKRWQALRPSVDAVIAQLPQAAATRAPSAEKDWAQWHADDTDLEWTRHARSRNGEVGFVTNWLGKRADWLSRNEVRLGDLRMKTPERARTVWFPVDLHDPKLTPVDVGWSVVGLSAEAGVDFVAQEGSFTFASREVRHYIPVQILDDDVTEGRELIAVVLRNVSPDVVIGSPPSGSSRSTPTSADGSPHRPHLTRAASRGSGHGLSRQPPVPLDCCIITGALLPRRGQDACPSPSQ